MATQTGKTRTLAGYMTELLEYPRWVIERDVDFTNCRYGGHYNAFIEECVDCRFGPACRWLNRHHSASFGDASAEELTEALEAAARYLRSTHPRERSCCCRTCQWLREARHFRRSHPR